MYQRLLTLLGIDKFYFLYLSLDSACTTISVYENISKNSFFFSARKTPPHHLNQEVVPVLRVQRYSFFTNQQNKLRRILQNFTKLSVKPTIYTLRKRGLHIYINAYAKECKKRRTLPRRGLSKLQKWISSGGRAFLRSRK